MLELTVYTPAKESRSRRFLVPSMPTMMDSEEERQEVAAVLASGIFSRAPSLALLLSYICEKHFEGQAGQIKEYNIAVEAMGRNPDFDQKRDSIVRVEAHRLRKRLKEYYDAAGMDHRIRIEIPSGQYAPKFVASSKSGAELIEAGPTGEIAPILQPPLQTVQGPPLEFTAQVPRTAAKGWFIAVGLAAAVGVFLAGAWFMRSRALATTVTSPQAIVLGKTVRINAGATKPYTDRFGQVWAPDVYFSGGTALSTPNQPVQGTRDPKLYQNRREGAFAYDIPLEPGSHELRLHFAELIYGEANIAGGGETSRLFNITANGQRLIESLDLIANAGPSNACVRVFKDISPARDGILHLRFEPAVSGAVLSGIEIHPALRGACGRSGSSRAINPTPIKPARSGKPTATSMEASL